MARDRSASGPRSVATKTVSVGRPEANFPAVDLASDLPASSYATAASKPAQRPPRQWKQSAPNSIPMRKAQSDFIVSAEFARDSNADASTLLPKVKQVLRKYKTTSLSKIEITRIRSIAGGKVYIVAPSDAHRNIILDVLEKDKTKGFTRRKLGNRRPQIKAIGLDSDLDPNDIIVELLKFNIYPDKPDDFLTDERIEQDIRFLFKRKSWAGGKNSNLSDFFFEVDPTIEKQLLKLKKVKIDMQMIKIQAHRRLIQCMNCCKYGHVSSKCSLKDKKVCSRCAGDHDSNDCEASNEHLTCVNCVEFNSTLRPDSKQKVKTNHVAYDPQCPMRAKAIQRSEMITEHAPPSP